MLSDIKIAQACIKKNINEIASLANIDEEYLENYGKYKAKVDYKLLKDLKDKKNGKLILVTAINPTSAGEGKTTITIGLGDGLRKIGKKSMIALREPSLGPVFGVKGGATGGGYAQVVPMEDINLHFTGDFHAIGSANNLLCAMLDNHIKQGNSLNIDNTKIVVKRVVDMNDRQLRNIVDGLGGKNNGIPREDGFDITVACETMAILCLASDIVDLKKRLSKMIVAYSYDGKPITVADLKAEGAMAALLKDALKPNLVQTLESTPVLIHGGPFANIAHGCNSLIATKTALKLSDYTVTEAGFGADLGAEKFLDIKCRMGNLKPDCVVIVATIRALKLHGGLSKDSLDKEDLDALKKGMPNLLRHIDNIKNVYKLPCVVAINRFFSDSKEEIELVKDMCKEVGVEAIEANVYEKGGEGATKLADAVVKKCEEENNFTFSYADNLTIKEKIETVVKKIYRGSSVTYSKKALLELKKISELGFDNFPVCIAKTQYSFSDDATKLGAPNDFEVSVKDIRIASGAGFIVVLTGDVMTMPGLPKKPAAENIDVDENGVITGLF